MTIIVLLFLGTLISVFVLAAKYKHDKDKRKKIDIIGGVLILFFILPFIAAPLSESASFLF